VGGGNASKRTPPSRSTKTGASTRSRPRGVFRAISRLASSSPEAIEALRQALTFTGVPPDMLGESGFALARALRAADVEAWVSSLGR
jgi:hypothetical protein